MISAVAALLAARLAAGSLLAAGLIRWRRPAPAAFSCFVLAGAAASLAIAIVLGRNRPERLAWVVLFGLTLALRLLHGRFGVSPRALAAAAAALGLAGAVAPPLLAGGSGIGAALAATASFSAAGLLGATAVTMVLGHWYLVDTTLSIRPLAFGAALFLGASALRLAVTCLALLGGGAAALQVSVPSDLIYSTTALFFGFRAVTGLAAPAVLSLLVRSTVRIRSTQSATGLLYVALILTLFGELTAVFLETLTGGVLV